MAQVYNTFGGLLKSIMRKRGVNQAWLVDTTGKDKKQISKYVNNHTDPMPDTLQEMSAALGVQIERSGDQYVLTDPFDTSRAHNLNLNLLHQAILKDAELLVSKIRRIIDIERSQQM